MAENRKRLGLEIDGGEFELKRQRTTAEIVHEIEDCSSGEDVADLLPFDNETVAEMIKLLETESTAAEESCGSSLLEYENRGGGGGGGCMAEDGECESTVKGENGGEGFDWSVEGLARFLGADID